MGPASTGKGPVVECSVKRLIFSHGKASYLSGLAGTVHHVPIQGHDAKVFFIFSEYSGANALCNTSRLS